MSKLIGSTPADWADTRLADICELIPGAATKEDTDGSVPVVKPRNLISGRVTGPTDNMDATEAGMHPRYRIRSGDLLCSRTGTVGRTGLAREEQEGWIFGSGIICIRIRPSIPVDPQYLSLYFLHPAVGDWVVRQARGTTIPNISTKVLSTLPVSLPPLSAQLNIARALAILNDSIMAHQQICDTATDLRDAILPLLLSGELRAP